VAERTRGMGRGLAALLAPPDHANAEHASELRHVPVELIAPNPRQPRREFDEAALLALAGSLGERGLLQPVLVRPSAGGAYELIAGERRWRAARLAGLETIPALVRVHDDAESLELALIENMAREDLNPIEEARACALLVEELGLTREEIGRRVGRSRVAVSNLLRLLDLPDEALEMLARGDLTEGHGRAILMAPGHDERRRLARAALAEGWNVRRTEAEARAASGADPAGPVRARRGGAHPDQEAAASRLGEALGEALGADVKVTPRGTGYKVAMTFESLDEALEFASRVHTVEPV
jgi:ParB family chromosome partitioning protein